MSRRAQITMTPEEVTSFLTEETVVTVATMGQNGRPHLVPLWYVPKGDVIETWTYGSSQKVRNLHRLARATVLVEAGETYDQLRGVSMECDVELVDDAERVARIGAELMRRYDSNEQVTTAATQFVRMQARKRVGLVFRPTRVASWDHRKLGGTY